MEGGLRDAARRAPGFLPEEEGLALYSAALRAPAGPFLEIGSYCGKSALYLGAAASERGTLLYSLDHHKGSEEQQPGEEYHDPRLVDESGQINTLPEFKKTIRVAGLAQHILPIVGTSESIAATWKIPLGFVFVDGGHSHEAAHSDYEGWTPHLAVGGLLAIHDVFPDPADGGRPPYEIYRRAVESGLFEDVSATGSLRVLRKLR
jgi:predicted O-methyltransferase YrrM